jgi:hypothetical protein
LNTKAHPALVNGVPGVLITADGRPFILMACRRTSRAAAVPAAAQVASRRTNPSNMTQCHSELADY